MKNNSLEIRSIQTEIRSLDDNSRKITGLAIPVNTRSELLYNNIKNYRFYETIEPQALEDVIERFDIKLYLNHDSGQGTYARSKFGSGSLHLFLTDRGLEFETELPNTVYGDMLLEGIRRGDFDAMSFAFNPDKDVLDKNPDGTYNRTITHIGLIDECSILSCLPAYSTTDVTCRSLETYIEEERKAEEEEKQKILDALDAKMQEFENAVNEIKL